jgi:hypothetical protein
LIGYTLIRDWIGIRSNDKIIEAIKTDLSTDSSQYMAITDFMLHVETYSKDFKIQNYQRKGIEFYSFTDIEESGISFEEYKKLYYGNIDTTTSGCYVPDFILPASFEHFLNKYNVRIVRMNSSECDQKAVSFIYAYRHFFPTDRIIWLKYFPEGICKNYLETKKHTVGGYYWIYPINNSWVIESAKGHLN